MLTSELIEKLTALMAIYGDKQVIVPDYTDEYTNLSLVEFTERAKTKLNWNDAAIKFSEVYTLE